jgi:CxxC motif-containing protein
MITKFKALEIVSNDGFVIDTLPIELQKDNDVIITALKQSYFSLVSIPVEHLNNNILAFIFDNNYQEYYDEIRNIIENSENKNVLENVNYNLKNNKKLIEILCVINSKTIRHASKEILNDKYFILNILKQYPGKYYKILKYLSYNLRDDDEIVKTLICIKTYTFELIYASDRLKKDYNFILDVIKYNGDILAHVSDELKNNKKIVLEAVKYNGDNLDFASNDLKNDKDIVLEAIKNIGNENLGYKNGLKYASNKLKNNKEVVLEAIKYDVNALQYASNNLKNNKEVILEAIKYDANALQYASKQLKNNKEVVLEAVNKDGNTLEYASNQLKYNKEIVLKAVQNDPNALQYASNYLKNNKQIVLEAVKIDGTILEYASEQLKNNKEIVLEAIKNDANALEYASKQLKNDKEIVLEAIKQNSTLLELVSEELKNNDNFLLLLIKNKPNILYDPYIKNKINKNLIFKILKLNLFSYLPINIKKKFKNLEKIYNHTETNINKIIDISFKNIKYFINDQYILNKIFKENLEIFIDIWYKNNLIRNILINYIENNEQFCNILSEEYNIVFENIKIFDENLSIDNFNDEQFINIKKLNEIHMKKILIYY